MTKRIRFRLSPELGDGQHTTIVDAKDAVLNAVADWLDEMGDADGESCEISTVAMTDEEVATLPDL